MWNTFYVPDTILRAGHTAVSNEDKSPCSHGTYILKEEIDDKNKREKIHGACQMVGAVGEKYSKGGSKGHRDC